MAASVMEWLGLQLRQIRARRGINQSGLAQRLGRNQARISELERDLSGNRLGRDRLTLLVEVCDTLDLVPILVPRARADAVLQALDQPTGNGRFQTPQRSTFDEVFVDLGADDPGGAD
nr:helix-turn-helix transcriptional regulator [Sphingomonas sp. Y57]